VNVQPCTAKSVKELLHVENLELSSISHPSKELAQLWLKGYVILIAGETDYYILNRKNQEDPPPNLLGIKKNTLINSILEEALLKVALTSLPPIQEYTRPLSLNIIINCFFDFKLDYLYCIKDNALISFHNNLSITHSFIQKKIKQLNEQQNLHRSTFEKNEQLNRALKYDLRQFQVAMYIPGMSWLGKLGKLIQPRLGNLYQYHPHRLAVPKLNLPALSNTPKISIVTPSFEQGRYLEDTIQSVLKQNYPNIEYIVKDGGSQDNSQEILSRYQNKLTYYCSAPDKGQSHAINVGFSHTSGEIMAWLNSDDLLLPYALHCVADYFNKHPEIDVIYGNRLLIDENNGEIGRWILPRHSNKALSWADFFPKKPYSGVDVFGIKLVGRLMSPIVLLWIGTC